MALYAAVLAGVVVVGLPVTVFEIIPGLLYGMERGFCVALVGKNVGNLVSVLLAKTLLREWVERTVMGRYKSLRVLERMTRNQGFTAILVFRGVVYAPLAIKNYGLGALDIPWWQTVLAGAITGAPYALWWAYLGSTAKDVVTIVSGGVHADVAGADAGGLVQGRRAALAAVLLAVVWWILRDAKAAWTRAKAEVEGSEHRD